MNCLLQLPDVALERIFSFLSYDEIARNRVVCKKFNNACGNLLSRGFMQIEKKHSAIYRRVKSMLPRRESERRIHPLFRHCDILSAVETRISMLNMTYMKYIQNDMCCFIPGKVLDELDRVLSTVEQPGIPPRTHELLQELRDISSMAMEYFDEKILPSIKGQVAASIQPFTSASMSTNNKSPKVYFVPPGLSEEMRKVLKSNKKQKAQITMLSKVIHKLYSKIEKQTNTIKNQSSLLKEHETKLQQQSEKLLEQENSINELKKHVDEWDQKFADLTTEVNRSREDIAKILLPELQEKDLQEIQIPIGKTFIRPRLAQVQAPNSYLMELERKRKSSLELDIPTKIRLLMPRESRALKLRETLNNKIKENITENLSGCIRNNELQEKTDKSSNNTFLSKSLDILFKPKSRKRRMTEELHLD